MPENERTALDAEPQAESDETWEGPSHIDASLEPAGSKAAPPPVNIGPYRVEAHLGSGGMGRVYAAFDTRLQRSVALKQILPRGEETSPEARARFWREARALAALNHPGVVTVYDIGEGPEGSLYLAMELVRGKPLSHFLKAKWPVGVAVQVAMQVAAALGAAHGVGIVHRDVKPSNLLIEANGQIKVIDFGLARRTEGLGESVTQTGSVIGTPAWMAPEQIAGHPSGPQTDVFAAGILLYRLLTGRNPFSRASTSATAMAIVSATYPPINTLLSDVPEPLAEVVERCLGREPSERYANGAELAAALNEAALAAGVSLDQAALRSFLEAPPALPEEAAALLTPGSAPTLVRPPARPSVEPLSLPAPQRRRLIALGVALVVAVLGVLAGWLAWGSRLSGRQVAQAEAVGNVALPPRPVVAFVGLSASEPDNQAALTAAMASDIAREILALDPDEVISVPLMTLLASGVEVGAGIDAPQWQLSLFNNRGTGAGHVDFVVAGDVSIDDDSAQVELQIHDVSTGRIAETVDVSAAGSPTEVGMAVGAELMTLFGGALPESVPRQPRVMDAYGAYLKGLVGTIAADAGIAREQLGLALQRDPALHRARGLILSLLAADRRLDRLVEEAQRIVDAGDEVDAYRRSMATVWLAFASGRGGDMLPTLYEMLELWPHHNEPLELLLTALFGDPSLRDLAETERVARTLMSIAPQSEGAASKLVRSLSFRGRAAEADAALDALSFPRDNPAYSEVWGEVALYQQDYAEAQRRFEVTMAHASESIYAENMLIATHILAGRCQDAAVSALERIDRVERKGQDSNLDWTYSLANQAMTCLRQWDVAIGLMERWAKHGRSGDEQSTTYALRLALVRGEDPAQVAVRVLTALEAETLLPNVGPELLLTLARAVEDADLAAEWAHFAERRAIDQALPAYSRKSYLRAGAALKARQRLLSGDVEGALKDYSALVFPWSEVEAEWDLIHRCMAMAAYAEALERVGADGEARLVWQELVGLGYERLWVTDLYVRATSRLEAAP